MVVDPLLIVTPIVGFCYCSMFCYMRYFVYILVVQSSESWFSFALFVFPVSRDCCVAIPRDATGLSAVCDCGIS